MGNIMNIPTFEETIRNELNPLSKKRMWLKHDLDSLESDLPATKGTKEERECQCALQNT